VAADPGSPPPRRGPSRATGAGLRDELVDAGVRVLAAVGDTGRLSIRAVAAEAGVTPTAVYRHFSDRRVLVRTVVETSFEQFEARLSAAEQGAPDPFEALRRRCRAYVTFGVEQPHLYRVLFGAWSAGPKALGTYGRRPHPGAGSFTALVTSIQRCINAGAQTRRPSPFLAFQLWSLLHGMTDLRAGKPEMSWPDTDDMVDHFLVCLALRARPRRAE
jgi:AcrR family transcriptional regulator